MNKLLYFIFFVLLSDLSVSADCTSCWELKYVQIAIEDGQLISGYIKWNTAWYLWLEDPDIKIPTTFPENLIEFYKKWKNGTAEIIIYKNLYKIGENEEWAGYFSTDEDISKVNFDKIRTIKKVKNVVDNISGAQELSIFNLNALKFINIKPNDVKKIDDGGCEYYILNYNNQIDSRSFNNIISEEFLDKVDAFEKQDIYLLKKCYD